MRNAYYIILVLSTCTCIPSCVPNIGTEYCTKLSNVIFMTHAREVNMEKEERERYNDWKPDGTLKKEKKTMGSETYEWIIGDNCKLHNKCNSV